jgi:hypothetical protein
VRLPIGALNKRLRLLTEKADAGTRQGSPLTVKLRDRYFRTEKEVMNDDRSLAVEPATRSSSRGISTKALGTQSKAHRAKTSAPSSLKDSKVINSQPSQKRPDPLPYFVREFGASPQEARPPIAKLRYPSKKKP